MLATNVTWAAIEARVFRMLAGAKSNRMSISSDTCNTLLWPKRCKLCSHALFNECLLEALIGRVFAQHVLLQFNDFCIVQALHIPRAELEIAELRWRLPAAFPPLIPREAQSIYHHTCETVLLTPNCHAHICMPPTHHAIYNEPVLVAHGL